MLHSTCNTQHVKSKCTALHVKLYMEHSTWNTLHAELYVQHYPQYKDTTFPAFSVNVMASTPAPLTWTLP